MENNSNLRGKRGGKVVVMNWVTKEINGFGETSESTLNG